MKKTAHSKCHQGCLLITSVAVATEADHTYKQVLLHHRKWMWLPIPQKKMLAIDILCSPFNHHALGKTGFTPFPHSHWQVVMSCRYFQGWESNAQSMTGTEQGTKIIGTCLFRSLSFSFLPKGAGATLPSSGNGFGIYSWKAPHFIILIFPLGSCLHLQCCWHWIKTPSSGMGLTFPPSFLMPWAFK